MPSPSTQQLMDALATIAAGVDGLTAAQAATALGVTTDELEGLPLMRYTDGNGVTSYPQILVDLAVQVQSWQTARIAAQLQTLAPQPDAEPLPMP